MSFGSNRKSAKPAGPQPVTATYLRHAAMHYISAHAASTTMARQVLERRAKRRLVTTTLDVDTRQLIDAAIAELQALGLLDDARFAEGRTAALARKGLSSRLIAQGLRAKGIARETIEKSGIGHIDELAQARRLVQRKRLGSSRRGGMTPESRRKDLAALARAGFTFAISAQALDPSEEC